MQYTETYRCNLCDTEWEHLWDAEDYNNDFTPCPNCFDFEFEDIEDSAYLYTLSSDGLDFV